MRNTLLANIQPVTTIGISNEKDYDDRNKSILIFRVSDIEQKKLTLIYREALEIEDELLNSVDTSLGRFFSQKIKRHAPEFASTLMTLHHQKAVSAAFFTGLPNIKYEDKEIAVAELMSLSYAFLMGEPFQYLQQNNGKLVARISPKVGFEETQSGFSRGNFGWHTDDRIFSAEHRTEWIQLLGVYNPGRSQTILSVIDEIIKNLSAEVLSTLMDKRFEIKMPTSFGFKNNIWSEPSSLIWLNENGCYEVGVPTYHVRVVNDKDIQAKNALIDFFRAIDICKQGVTLISGSLLIFNNNRLLHGRAPIVGDRMILRTYIRRNLNALRMQTGDSGYVFDARFLL